MGDSKTTGDLALIYARAAESSDVEASIKAYQRAIELSPENNQADAIAKVERYVDLIQALAKTRKITRARKPVKQAEALMQTYGLIGSTFDGEIKTLSGLVSYVQQHNGEALEKYNAAIEIFDGDGHKHSSIFPYTVRVNKGNLLGKKDAINAALEYQVVMQNLEGKLDKDHPLIRTAFNGWVYNMGMISQDDKLAEATQAGVCKCWPYDEMRAESPIPITRTPPIMPRMARRLGHVNFKFDVNDAGKVINHKVVNATEDIFIKSAQDSLSGWRFEPLSADDDPQTRKGLVARITFQLMDRKGRLIPELGE